MKRSLIGVLPVLGGLALFLVALEVLRVELRAVSWHEIAQCVVDTPPSRLFAALVLTALSYIALVGYDLVAFAYIGKTLPRRQVAGAAFLAYAISHNVGFAMLSGASVRYRFYSRWGVTAEELSRVIFSYSVTFWLGLGALGGLSLVVSPLPDAHGIPGHHLIALAGWILMTAVAAYLFATVVRREPFQWRAFTLPLPRPTIAVQQLLISAIDWALAGAVLYVLLPQSALTFVTFLGAFMIAILLGMASHVPGGIGVFEGLIVVLLRPYLSSGQLLPALVVYRAVYYLLPFSLALGSLTLDEAYQRRAHVARAGRWLGQVAGQVTPRVMAALTFFSGAVLLLSGATPASPGRLSVLGRIFPLGVLETSHFVGSIAGAGLLVLSHGLARRLDAAYYLSAVLILVGMAASLLKGFDYEEATLLAVVLVALYRARPTFDRRAAFFESRFSGAWSASVVGVVGASIWLGFFAFKHVDYSHALWWQFEVLGEAPRFLRASVGGAVVVLMVGVARLIGAAPHETPELTEADLTAAAAAIATQTAASPNLVYLRDKAVLFNESRDAFVMYGVQGRTWVALGDPVCRDVEKSDLIRKFLDRCDDFGGVPVFYQIKPTHLHRYADYGLTFVKIGEEATIDLCAFSFEAVQASRHRQAIRRLEKDEGSFRVVGPEEMPTILPQLRAVSDDWLREKSGAEKGFSLGFFDETYLSRFPVAVVERQGRVQAFSNLWSGPGSFELSPDLMRYSADAPKGVMEALLVHITLWGKEQGYRRLGLGMAPLSGFEDSPAATLWHRLGAFLYEHGESVYSFQGLRAYKEKFHPEWEPRYLAYPGGLRLPRILTDTSALIAGGYRRIFLK